jgi:putative transposase
MTFPNQHRTKLHSTNPLERLNKEVKRRADVVGSYMQIEGMAELTPPLIDADPAKLPPLAA